MGNKTFANNVLPIQMHIHFGIQCKQQTIIYMRKLYQYITGSLIYSKLYNGLHLLPIKTIFA